MNIRGRGASICEHHLERSKCNAVNHVVACRSASTSKYGPSAKPVTTTPSVRIRGRGASAKLVMATASKNIIKCGASVNIVAASAGHLQTSKAEETL